MALFFFKLFNGQPVIKKKDEGSPVPTTPFYVENITNSAETLTITGAMDEEVIEIPVEYSTDGTTWGFLGTTGATPLTRTLQPNDKVYLRATTNAWCSSNIWEAHAEIQGISKVGGNIMSLLYGSNFTGNETTFPTSAPYTFSYLFMNNTNLVDASDLVLPATTLAESCYFYMFYYCTGLATPPTTLPATTLANYCYNSMFQDCTALTTAPTLPATTLATGCYDNMFADCTALATAPTLSATTLAPSCYNGMFYGCTSLTTAPELPATTLAVNCYSEMFMDCTSLNYIKCLATDISASSCTSIWVSNVSATGTFVKDPNMSESTWGTGNNGIPSGWTVEDATI